MHEWDRLGMTDQALRVGIVYDDSLDRPGGVVTYITTLAAELRCRGHHVALLVGETSVERIDDVPVFSLSQNVGVRFNGNRLSTPLRTNRGEIERVVKEHHFDVLHVQMPYSPFMAARVVAAADPRTAVVGTFHIAADQFTTQIGTRLLGMTLRSSSPRFDRIAAVSGSAAWAAECCFGVKVDAVIPNMTPTYPGSRPPAGYARLEHGSIVFLGRLVPRKGVAYLIDAVGQLRSAGIDVQADIAGDGPLRKRLERRRDRLGLSGAVRFLGDVTPAERSLLFAGADVACFPAIYGESFGTVLIEAMAGGAGAVVGSRIPGFAEVLANVDDALVPPGDPAALAERLELLLRDDRRRIRLGKNQRRIVERYSAERVTTRILSVYARALADRGADRPLYRAETAA
jgi:phosphatidylinositol alpha-mannosyltransferase